jgi:hypothetical protein
VNTLNKAYRSIVVALAMAVMLTIITALAVSAAADLTDSTVANFQAGAGCYAAPSDVGDINGELLLTPTIGITFTGTILPAGWNSGLYSPPNGAITVTSGSLLVDGAYANSGTAYGPTRTLEFEATFSAAPSPYEHIGFSQSGDVNAGDWAIFTTRPSGSELHARTNLANPAMEESTPLGSTYLGTFIRSMVPQLQHTQQW